VFKDPIPDGGAKGSHLTEGEFNFLLSDYYTARGWTSDGKPTKKKLSELGLEDVAKEIGV
jgi:aldehyde:ferredoxin oxidoreductase